MINKKIIVVDFILIVGTLFVIAGLVGYTRPMVIAPADDFVSNGPVLFSFEKADLILIDDNLDFISPEKIYVEDNLVINLLPGEYYWKVSGVGSSLVRKLTIVSEVDLKLIDRGDNYEIVNSGNNRLNVEIYQGAQLSGNVVLDVDETKEVSGTKFVGRENE